MCLPKKFLIPSKGYKDVRSRLESRRSSQIQHVSIFGILGDALCDSSKAQGRFKEKLYMV